MNILTSVIDILMDLVALAIPVLAMSIGSAWLVLWGLRRASVTLPNALKLFPLAFAILGGIAGVMAGSSQEALVGGLVTALLGLISALLSYAFAKEGNADVRAALPPVMVLLLINALVGLSVGQNWKKKWIEYSNTLEETKVEHRGLWMPVTLDYRKRMLEKCAKENEKMADLARNCDPAKLWPYG